MAGGKRLTAAGAHAALPAQGRKKKGPKMAVTSQSPAKSGFIHGWMVVFAAFVAFALVYGTVLYSFTAFVNPVAKTFGASVAQVQLAFAATNVGTGILGIFGGMLLSRYSKRLCIIVGLA